MKSVGVKQLKSRLSEYLRLVRSGETVLVTDRDEVVAELRPFTRRQPGTADSLDELLDSLAERGEVTRASLHKRRWKMEGKGAGPCRRLRHRAAGRNSQRPVTFAMSTSQIWIRPRSCAPFWKTEPARRLKRKSQPRLFWLPHGCLWSSLRAHFTACGNSARSSEAGAADSATLAQRGAGAV